MRPAMKLIDRYLLREYLAPLLYCVLAFCMVYIVWDLFDNFSTFIQAQIPARTLLAYYLAFLPAANGPCSFLLVIVPVSLLVSALYALWRLARHNELTAMRASGLGLYRILGPFLSVGIVCAVGTGLIQEFVTPQTTYWTYTFRQQLKRGDGRETGGVLPYVNERARREWIINGFEVRKPTVLHNVTLRESRGEGAAAREIWTQADEARWLDGCWWFLGVRSWAYDANGNPVQRYGADGELLDWKPPAEPRREMRHLKETPEDFVNEMKEPRFLSARALWTYLERHKTQLSKRTAAQYAVDMHIRLAMPWSCVLVALVGFSTGARTERQGAIFGILAALGVFFAYYTCVYVGDALGKAMVLSPWLGGWLPNIVFCFVGLVLLCRMR